MTTDGMFALRQLREKRLDMQGRMAVGYVETEKAYDTVPREMMTVTVRWMGVPEAEARMVKAMNDIIKGRVGSGLAEEFPDNISLRKGSGLALYHSDGTNQQEVQHEGCSQDDDVCRRSGHNSTEQTRTTGRVGGMEGRVQESRDENEPGEDRSDVGGTP